MLAAQLQMMRRVIILVKDAASDNVTFVDEVTGKRISTTWNKIPSESRDLLKGIVAAGLTISGSGGAIEKAGATISKVTTKTATAVNISAKGGVAAEAQLATATGIDETYSLINELKNRGIKFNPNELVKAARIDGGKIIFLENGNANAGLQHILNEHSKDFVKKGISVSDVPDLLFQALAKGKVVGYQGGGIGRPIYEVTYKGNLQRVAITSR